MRPHAHKPRIQPDLVPYTVTQGNDDYCDGCTCKAGQGDCDANHHCDGAPGLVCGTDNCEQKTDFYDKDDDCCKY